MNREQYFEDFFEYIEKSIRRQGEVQSIASEVERLEKEGGIPAQKFPRKGKFEEIFTSAFLVEHIAGFHFSAAFREAFALSGNEIRSGLAYEGWNQPGMDNFDSSPVVNVGFKTLLSKGAAGWKGS